MMRKITWLAALLILLSSCGAESDESGQNDTPYEGPTYHADIKPLMNEHCTSCHVTDSIAPFSLQTYSQVEATALVSRASMESRSMPPWPPADDCGEFLGHRGMSADEIALFGHWVDEGMVEGEPADGADHSVSSEEDTFDRVPDLTLDIGVDYAPEPVGDYDVDDYRCFVVDPEIDEDVFVQMVDTHPGNPEIVHHMIAYFTTENQDELIADLEAEDDRPGYTCFGGPRLSEFEMLAGWVPGQMPTPFREGHGVRLPSDAKLVIQMHYNTLNDPEGMDRTELDLFFVDREEFPSPVDLVFLPLAQTDLFIEAGDPDAVVTAAYDDIPISLTLHGVAPHMHMLGTEIRAEAQTGDEDICLVHIPDWDFNWQGFYVYEEPVELPPGVTASVTCHYDNSPENQPAGQQPRDVTWGDGTFDEMCLVFFIVERPPGL